MREPKLELQDLSTKQIKTLLQQTKGKLSDLERELTSKENQLDSNDDEIYDLQREQEKLCSQIDEIEDAINLAELRIEEIENFLLTSETTYTMEELEEAGQMVMLND